MSNAHNPASAGSVGPASHRRPSRSNSVSSSSISTIKRSASLSSTSATASSLAHRPSDAVAADSPKPYKKSSALHPRRRSSVAHATLDGISAYSDGNLNRWSQSTGSSKSSAGKDHHHHHHRHNNSSSTNQHRRPTHARRLSSSNSNLISTNGSPSPQRHAKSSSRHHSPPPSPRRRPPRPASPSNYSPSTSLTALPPIGPLPTLSSKVYDPNAAPPSSTPSSTGAFTPLSQGTGASSDYFGSRPRTPYSGTGGRSTSAQTRSAKTDADLKTFRESRQVLPGGLAPAGPAAAVQRPPRIDSRDRRGTTREIEPRWAENTDSSVNGHSRGRSDSASRQPGKREMDKKAMLSRALQKANTAVLLDNASNFEGAIEAYSDACNLLQQVTRRSPGEDDKKRLEAIRVTYTNRIEELKQMHTANPAGAYTKSLPARPMSDESLSAEATSMFLDTNDDDEPIMIETATVTRIVNDISAETPPQPPPQPQQQPLQPPPPMQINTPISKPLPEVSLRELEKPMVLPVTQPGGFLADPSPLTESGHQRIPPLESPLDRPFVPPPLSPRLPSTSYAPPNAATNKTKETPRLRPAWEPRVGGTHSRDDSVESVSWLDTKDDDSRPSSCASSVHSVSSRTGIRRKHLHTGSAGTEAEFDAALDAAVEAAYDDGFEPYEDDEPVPQPELMSIARRNVELAKERVREIEREEAIAAARVRERTKRLRGDGLLPHVRESFGFEYNAEEVEEEERILEEMRKDYLLDDFDFGLQTKSALPRESDSSGFSGSTWNSSISSSKRTTGGLSLTTVTEASESRLSDAIGTAASQPPLPTTMHDGSSNTPSSMTPRAPQPTGPLPPPPPANSNSAQGVRDRRLSGQNPKQLKIETSIGVAEGKTGPLTQHAPSTLQRNGQLPTIPQYPKSAGPTTTNNLQQSDTTFDLPHPGTAIAPSLASGSSQLPSLASGGDTVTTISPATPALGPAIDSIAPPSPSSIGGKATLKKNKSSLSLKNRNFSVSSPDGSDAGSVSTPLSSTFASFPSRKPSVGNIVQTPLLPTFTGSEALPTGGMHLFESDIHSPYSPGSPNPMAINAPIPLEPCPDSYLLRPFWLMRCFYQTIAHPRGGYLSTKLFVPRDVWRVKGVKIKATDEKISNCDLLTAALLKLSSVDSTDADAMLEEMQSFEAVLDQVQSSLVKKLGHEVGVNGVSTLFKDALTVGSAGSGDAAVNDPPPKSSGGQSKGYLSSWRKLRSKNSSAAATALVASKEVSKDSLTMSTLPMTSLPNIRFAKRNITDVEFTGPNANYMGALARLFDAAQIVDQIARQVEDPGLKHSSPTHVGLELCTRHAAEFFGFYICRFVLTDLTTMLDKFIKRGSEWVLV